MYRNQARNLVDILHWRGGHQSERTAFTFVSDEGVEATWTYGELDRRARAFAVALRDCAQPGDRALLLCPAGVEYAGAIIGCFYAGVVAVPAYPPGNARQIPRIDAILRDAGTDLIVTTTETRDRIVKWLEAEGRAQSFRFLCVDAVPIDGASDWRMPDLTPQSLAFLQYTSGSTSEPKGVMVGHSNLMANLAMLERSFQWSPESEWGTWLPMFHDMGLVGNVLEPFYLGAKTVMMSPQAFVREPVQWLRLMSRHRSNTTGAPNFGYALCARNVTEEQRRGLDLSALTIAYCGSEPIDPRVMDRFSEVFRECGFRREAFYPCYGMAEATLFSTGSIRGAGPRYLTVDSRALESGRAMRTEDHGPQGRVLAGSGYSAQGQDLRIVDPESRRALPDGQVGEVWLKGPHIAQGYWRNGTATEEIFQAALESGEGPYLRTGDLAFLDEGNLFVTGRRKDLIIIRGRNVYPQDIERTVVDSSAALQLGGGAAFSIDVDGAEELVIVQEVRRAARDISPEEVAAGIRAAVFTEHEIAPYAVVLLKTSTLPKTSSGKVRRSASRKAFLENGLEAVFTWTRPATPDEADGGSGERARNVIEWFRGYAETRIDARLIDERRTIPPYVVLDFGNHGLLGLQAPCEAGGLGLSYRDAFRVLQQVAAFDFTLGSFLGVHNALGLRPLLRFGSESQKRELVPVIAAGRELASFAYTEPGAGSNPGAIESTATPDGTGGWILHGSKKWIGTAAWSGFTHVFAHVLDKDGRHQGIGAFVVRQGTPGFVQGPEELTMGMRGMVQNTVQLNGVRVGPDSVLGELGQAMIIAQDAMELGRICIAACAVGVMKRAAQLMARYARTRGIATGRLLDNLVTRDRLTQLTTETAALEAFTDSFAGWLDAGIEVPKECFAAIKALAAESAFTAVDRLMQLLGGRGYIETNLAPQMLRDVRLMRVFEGPSETMQMFVGHRLAASAASLTTFLRDQLSASEIATELENVSRDLKQRATSATSGDDDGWRDGQRVAMILGELGMYGLWLAVVDRAPGDRFERSRAWLRARFDTLVAAARAEGPGQGRTMSAPDLERVVAGYANEIGDIEPYRPGVLQELDPLLARGIARETRELPGIPIARRSGSAPAATQPLMRDKVTGWLRQWLAQRLGYDPATIGLHTPFAEMGLDSITAVELTRELERSLNVSVAPTATWDFPNIAALAGHAAAIPKSGTKPSADGQSLEQLSERELTALLEGELRRP